ncbi:amino acid adenylation domain-containing protein [Paenibacillus sp. SYP-B3998]|uniref:Amino acid adenylation domain-containing protein n=1 Tax=Paenibacillus sp. SYP-B3998 TaxID=2678564 RepID=A0A6G4A0R6_9BACL|nr:non-ribosomal peptide synthetase [Paenibacillus sp. SYP-B3998]NEW07888.1 amino acid adenylation domain-containing protein [Paenibacillus sp. SYP-B3998]
MKNVAIQNIYPLTPMQEGLLYHSILDGGSEAYFDQTVITLNERLDPGLLERSFQALVNRHDVLRTIFVYKETERPLQVVLEKHQASIHVEDISHLTDAEQQDCVKRFSEQDRKRRFDLEKDLLIRLSVLQLGGTKSKLVLSFHHIIMDGWCIGTVAKDLFQLYRAYGSNRPVDLAPVFPYSGYISWLEKQDKVEALSYWKQYLEGIEQQSALPVGIQSAGSQAYQLNNRIFTFNQALTKQLEAVARQNEVTLSTVFHGIWGLLLQKYNNTKDVVFGSVTSGRPAEVEGVETMVGLFINTVPVRVVTEETDTFSDILKQLQHAMMDAGKYHYVSLADIQSFTPLKSGLIHHIVAFENYPAVAELSGDEDQQIVSIAEVEGFEQTNFDFNIGVIPGDELRVKFAYNRLVYEPSAIARLEAHLKYIAGQIAADPNVRTDQVELLTPEEQQYVFGEFNNTAVPFPDDATLQQFFEEQVTRNPDRVAMVFGNEQLTYRALNEKANRLARVLREQGVQPNRIVGISVYRSLEMMIGILAIIKAGGAYLPIHPEDPEDRIRFILQDSGASLLLTQPELLNLLAGLASEFTVRAIELELSGDGSDLPHVNQPGDLAYVIYTSGSTGRPKGVMIEHASLINRISWMQKKYPLSPEDVILQKTAFTFDVSVWELFWWAWVGASVCFLPPGGEKDPVILADTIQANGVTVLHFVPSMLAVFLEHVEQRDAAFKLQSVKRVFASGEALAASHVKRFNRLLHQTIQSTLHNLYGPTEATVDVTYYDCPVSEEPEHVPIGRPIDNIRAYILDHAGCLLPVGIPGELHVAGVGVARGYVNRPELTAEKFVADPFVPGGRMYKTGDLARWLPDGNIEYLGRIDHQVKIRGYRIEVDEIIALLLTHPDVKQAVVLAREDETGEKYLCAYVVSDRELTLSELRGHLKASLPDYMIPGRFVPMESLPFLANGKMDRKALPEPDAHLKGSEYESARTETEKVLVDLWESVLKVSPIGIRNDFFALGGHSLKATLLISKINRALHIEIPMRQVFEHPTIEGMSRYISQALGKETVPVFTAIAPIKERDDYPVSFAQKRQLILHQMEGAELVYNMPSAMLVQGAIDRERLERVFSELVARHEALRTSFAWVEGEPVQRIHNDSQFQLVYTVIQPSDSPEEEQIEAALSQFVRPFDLEQAPLLRAELVQLTDHKHILLVDMHHIISDGVSVSIIMDEFGKIYQDQELPPPSVSYKAYAHWQNEQFAQGAFAEQEAFWLRTLSGELPVLQLPTDFPRPLVQSFVGGSVTRIVGEDVTGPLRKLAAETQTTLFMVLLAAYNVLLSKYTHQEDMIVGSPIAGRRHPDVERTVGMFVNTLAFRNYPSPNKTFKAFLAEVKEQTLAAFDHQEFPFEQLVEKLALRRDVSRNPLFDTMFVMQNTNQEPLRAGDAEFKPIVLNPGVSRFDLTLSATEKESNLHLDFEYSSPLFLPETIERFASHFIKTLKSIAGNSDQTLGEVYVLTAPEQEVLLGEFNDTAAPYPKEHTIHGLFEEQVERTPDRVAVIMGEEQLTYRELNEQANRLARVLREKGVGPDRIVGIAVHRSLEMIIGLMAIHKAGGAYLPIQPEDPVDRVLFTLEDSGAVLILTQRKLLEPLRPLGAERELLGIEDALEQTAGLSGANLEPVNVSSDLVYVIYTSGSTGRPKGVMIEHASLINRLNWMQHRMPFGAEDVILQKTPYTFDVSLWELFSWAIQGARLCFLPPGGEKDPGLIADTIEAHGITAIHFVPSMLGAFLDVAEQESWFGRLGSVKRVFASGEALMSEHVKRFNHLWRASSGATLHNLYGPTEATVEVAYYDCPPEEVPGSIPIGRPLDNVRLYVLDKADRLMPVGVPGELHIGGDCLARGYLNRPDLTAEKFVRDPFADGGRMYRTGDLARWLPDGNIEYLGRIDHQVKIRGYRIELGEIEAALLAQDGVKEAVVLARDDRTGAHSLCAYVSSDEPLSGPDIKERLKSAVPDYMVPTYIVTLDRLPHLSNGKVDRKALPEPDDTLLTTVNYMPPASELESVLVEIWQEVLGYRPIGTLHNFFELGGDSIKAIQIASRLSKHGWKLEIKDMFRHQTIGNLTPYVRAVELQIDQGTVTGDVIVSPIQQWFFDQNFADKHHWNQAVMLYSEGGLQADVLDRALRGLIQHHDALRTTFKAEQDEITPYIHGLDNPSYTLRVTEITDELAGAATVEGFCNEIQQSMNLEQGPLVQAGLFKTRAGDYLLIAIHHLVVDGVSWRVLLEDLEDGYIQASRGDKSSLPSKTHSWKEWTSRLREYADSKLFLAQKRYWSEFVNQTGKSLLRNESARVRRAKDLDTWRVSFSKRETERLLTDVHKAYNTEINDILLTGLGLALRDWNDEEQWFLMLEGHGREEIFEQIDVTRTVGWFTTMYPILLEMGHRADLPLQIKTVKEQLRRVPNKGIGYGVLKYMTSPEHKEEVVFRLQPEIRFNYQGHIEGSSASALFRSSDWSSGRSLSEEAEALFVLDINGSIENGVLTLSIEYSRHELEQSEIQQLGERLHARLVEVSNHCAEKEEKELTPADLGSKELSIDELNDILAYYK